MKFMKHGRLVEDNNKVDKETSPTSNFTSIKIVTDDLETKLMECKESEDKSNRRFEKTMSLM